MIDIKLKLPAIASALFLMAGAGAAKAQGNTAKADSLLTDAQATLPRSPPQTATVSAQTGGTATPTKTTAPSSAKVDAKDKTVFTRLHDEGFRLQLGPGLSGDDAGPARFSFDKDLRENTDTVFNAAFLLGWSPASSMVKLINPANPREIEKVRRGSESLFGDPSLTWVWDTSIQGNLTTQSDNKADSWTFRIGGAIDHVNPDALMTVEQYQYALEELKTPDNDWGEVTAEVGKRFSGANASFYKGSWWSFAGKLEADKDFDNQRFSFEMEMTPTTSLPGNGIYWPSRHANPDAPMRFIWRPYFGIDAGGQIASDGTIDSVDDTLRGILRMTGKLSLDFLARALGLPEVGLVVSNTASTHNFLSPSLATVA